VSEKKLLDIFLKEVNAGVEDFSRINAAKRGYSKDTNWFPTPVI
jgi:hypothetical protein